MWLIFCVDFWFFTMLYLQFFIILVPFNHKIIHLFRINVSPVYIYVPQDITTSNCPKLVLKMSWITKPLTPQAEKVYALHSWDAPWLVQQD